MRTALSDNNPFPHNRYGYLWASLSVDRPARHLDYGAYDGAVLKALADTGVVQCGVGVDANSEAVDRGAPKMPPSVELRAIEPKAPLPFADDTFDSASLLDVLEHVVDQDRLLKELHRVTRPGAMLVVTTPRRYILSCLDTGNWKFRFKRLHRLVVTLQYGHNYYRQHYVDCVNGLFGDIEVGKSRHEHFTIDGLTTVLGRNGFAFVSADGSGFFGRAIVLLKPLAIVPGLRRVLSWLTERDAARFSSSNLYATFRTEK